LCLPLLTAFVLSQGSLPYVTQLLHSGEITWHVDNGAQHVTALLLTDQVVVTSRGYMAQCTVNRVIHLEGLRVEDPDHGGFGVVSTPTEADPRRHVKPHSFILDNAMLGIREEFTCRSDELKRAWINEIHEAILKAYIFQFSHNGVTVSESFFDVVNLMQGQIERVRDPDEEFMEGIEEASAELEALPPSKPKRVPAIPKVVQSEGCSSLTPRPEADVLLLRTVVMELRMLEDKFDEMCGELEEKEEVMWEPFDRFMAGAGSHSNGNGEEEEEQPIPETEDGELDIPTLLDQVFADLDMLTVMDDEKMQHTELERMRQELAETKQKREDLEPTVSKLNLHLAEVNKELHKNRENLIASFQKRRFVYMINRSTMGWRRRERLQLIASLHNGEKCFLENMKVLDQTATSQMRMTMGSIPAIVRNHNLLATGYEQALGRLLCVGPALRQWVKKLDVYETYIKDFDSNDTMRKSQMKSADKAREHDALQKGESSWGGIDLASFLMMPVDHLFRMTGQP